MKRNTPLITLLAGAALGVVLLVASMLTTPSSAPANYSAAAASSAAPAESVRLRRRTGQSAEAPEPAESSAAASAPPRLPRRDEDDADQGRLHGPGRRRRRVGRGGGPRRQGDRVRLQRLDRRGVDAGQGGRTGSWSLTGKNQTHLTASIHTGKVTGDVEAHGTDYSFSVPTVSKSSSKSSGLYQATAVVQGKTIKAGWIVLGDGTQIGSLETDESAETAVTAPKLDVATMTARIGNVVLHAVPVSGVTGSGF